MCEMSKKSCVIYDSWGELLANLPDEMAGQLIKQIITYAFEMKQPPMDNPAIGAMFSMIKTKLDEDAEKYQAKVDRLKNNSERNRNDIDTISERYQDDIGGVSDSVSVSDKDIKDKRSKFVKPTVDEVKAYCQERGNNVDPYQFVDFYESKGWKVGNQPMKDWKAAIRSTWEKRQSVNKSSPPKEKPKSDIPKAVYDKIHDYPERKIDYAALQREVFGN